MDSITQAVLGASVASVCVPAAQRRKAALIGAVLGTLPDLDVLIDYGDAVANFTNHRQFSHSLFVLVPCALFIWLPLRRWWGPVTVAPRRWLVAILLALVTHPLLDAHTAYGTQLWWPLSFSPTAWSTLFIIDPLFTIPLLIGVLAVLRSPFGQKTQPILVAGILTSSLYLGWSWVGKTMTERNARLALAAAGIHNPALFSTPTPFNTILWRIVVLVEGGYLEGSDSLIRDEGPIRFKPHLSDVASLDAANDIPAVERLGWFSKNFLKATVEGSSLVLSDLRMGQEPHYVFSFVVAEAANPHWRAIETRRVLAQFGWEEVLRGVWSRIWNLPREPGN